MGGRSGVWRLSYKAIQGRARRVVTGEKTGASTVTYIVTQARQMDITNRPNDPSLL